MALLHIPLADIDERQLKRLIDAKASESRDIEYKRDPYGNADGDHAEWLADVSSFANTAGGDLIIGIEANKGVPNAVRAADDRHRSGKTEARTNRAIEPPATYPESSVQADPVFRRRARAADPRAAKL